MLVLGLEAKQPDSVLRQGLSFCPLPVCSFKRSETVWPSQKNLGQLRALATRREARTLERLLPRPSHLLMEDKGSLSVSKKQEL